MKKILLSTLLLIILSWPALLVAGDNPLISKAPDKKPVTPVKYPALLQGVLRKIAPLQHRLSNLLVKLIREIKTTHSKRALFIIVFVSLIYGMLHALGPGHGKTLTFSYFLSKKANISKGIIAGNLIAFFHAISALIVVLTLYFIVKKTFLTSFEDLRRITQVISYVLIILIGLFLLMKSLVDLSKKKSLQKDSITYEQVNMKSMLPIVLAIGMIPCPGAVIILLFSISMGVLNIGIMLTLIMALGMAVTISSVGVLTIITKQGVLKFVFRQSKMRNIFQVTSGIIGSLLILSFGTFLLLGSI